MGKPVFLLGVGAHKAGTSFLYNALKPHPQAAFVRPKEMHVFDAHFLPDTCGQFHRQRCAALADRLAAETPAPERTARHAALATALRAEADGAAGAARDLLAAEAADPPAMRQKRVATLLAHVRMHYDLDLYAAMFRERARGHALTGDITPAYQMLEAEHFAAIRDLLAPDFDLRVVFLMRDPIERVFSAMRMDDRNQKRTRNLAHERFGETFMHPKHSRRTDYPRLIKALEATFPPERLFFGFYETLFTPETFARLTNFLGLGALTPDFDTRVNASPTRGALPPEATAAARKFYAPVYDFCMARFGADKPRALWPNA